MDNAISRALTWVAARLGLSEPPTAERIAAGRSNLTYRLRAEDDRTWVLRRPPLGHLLAGAHDMEREFRILTGLRAAGTVPAPAPLVLCQDRDILGVPFYVMEDVPGVVLRAPADAAALGALARANVAASAVGVLAAIHEVDLDGCGLGDLGSHSGYVARQIRRWLGQVRQSTDVAVDRAFIRLGSDLGQLSPKGAPHTLVHGDYRLDNLIVDPSRGTVRAVVDWEIGTVGDPLADLASFLISWDEPEDAAFALGAPSATAEGGFASRQAVAERYFSIRPDARAEGVMTYYLAFAYWKLACILWNVAARYRAGGGGGATSPPPGAEHVRWLLGRSAEHLAAFRRTTRSSLT